MYTFDYIKSKDARKDIVELFRTQLQSNDFTIEKFHLPKLLFRYSSLNRHTLKNLQENSLCATIPAEFNDLYDSTMHFNTVLQYQNSINELNKSYQALGYDKVIDSKNRELLLVDAVELDAHKLTYLTEDFRIVCFTTLYKDIRMWSHYGNKNKGLCIGYNLSKSKYEIDNFVYPVIYIDKPIDVTELCEDDNKLPLAILISIISKFSDWKDEKEWRMIFYLMNCKEKRIPIINVPKPECIFLGNKFIDHYTYVKRKNKNESNIIEEFLDYTITANIQLKIAEPQIRSFNLEYRDIDAIEIRKKRNKIIL